MTTSRSKKPALADAVVLTCLDFRYPHRIVNTMDARGLRGRYDHLILPGGSLGVTLKPSWTETFLDQLRFAVEAHGISQVVLLDHRDCMAFQQHTGISKDDPEKERLAHKRYCDLATTLILEHFPQLEGNITSLLLPVERVDEL